MTDKASLTNTSPAQRICESVRCWFPGRTLDVRYAIVGCRVYIYARDIEPSVLAGAVMAITRDKVNKLPGVLIGVEGKDGDEAFVSFQWLAREVRS